MKIIPPLSVTSAELDATNVAITETEWTAGTYNTGVQRYVGTRLYEVVAEPSTSDNPTTGVNADPPSWIDVGAINRFKMFDLVIGDATEQSSADIDVTVVFPQVVNAVALFEVVGDSVQVIVTDDTDGEVYNRTKDLTDNTGINNWYQYFFAPIARTSEVVFLDLPAYGGADIRVIVEADGNDTAVGECIFGRVADLGLTLQDFQFDIEDFSRKERDAFGRFIIVERRFAKLSNYTVFLENSQVNFANKTLAGLRATPAVYVGSECFPETITLGFYRTLSNLRTGPASSEMLLEVEGLI